MRDLGLVPFPTWGGWVYLATVIDCYTKAVIGWAIGDNYKTPLITAAITMAARNHTISSGAIFHSDRGINQLHVRRIREDLEGSEHSAVGGSDRYLL
jgi:transposase InsO family protein